MRFWRTLKRIIADFTGPDIRFAAVDTRADIAAPVQAARDVRPEWLRKQYAEKPVKLARCPGMWDYLQAGYIIPAWCDIHIKANRAGVSIRMEGANHIPAYNAVQMDFPTVEGMAQIKESVRPCVLKIPVPYAILTKRGISAQVLPAVMHSPFLDKLFVYPGVVDYDSYQTVNFIFSATEECEFTIWAGTPLLQVIPFHRRTYTAECGPATVREAARKTYGFISRRAGLYRRLFHSVKKYKIEVRTDL